MSQFADFDTEDPTVADALDLIEADLAEAMSTASSRLQAVLDGKPAETKVLYSHIADLNRMLSHLAENRERRARRAWR